MIIRPARLRMAAVLLAACSTFACETDDTGTMIGPSSVRASDAAYVSRLDFVEPAVVTAVVAPAVACPLTPPFFAPVNLVVHGGAVSNVSLTGVQMRFTDVHGTVGGFTTLSHSDLTRHLGSTVVPVFGTRAFPLSFAFGCVGVATGTLNVVAFVTDASGHERRTSHVVRVTAR